MRFAVRVMGECDI